MPWGKHPRRAYASGIFAGDGDMVGLSGLGMYTCRILSPEQVFERSSFKYSVPGAEYVPGTLYQVLCTKILCTKVLYSKVLCTCV